MPEPAKAASGSFTALAFVANQKIHMSDEDGFACLFIVRDITNML
jgi:hypothetical protein